MAAVVSLRDSTELQTVLAILENWPASMFSLHPGPCCRAARGWFKAMARASAQTHGPEPTWISGRWAWGPTRWPIFWCDAVSRRALDCGGLAALAEIALQENGTPVCRVQLVVEHARERVEHWEARWRTEPGSPVWTWGKLVYHEAVGVRSSSTIRLWDATESGWHDRVSLSMGRIVAMKLTSAGELATVPRSLHWRSRAVPEGRWIRVS